MSLFLKLVLIHGMWEMNTTDSLMHRIARGPIAQHVHNGTPRTKTYLTSWRTTWLSTSLYLVQRSRRRSQRHPQRLSLLLPPTQPCHTCWLFTHQDEDGFDQLFPIGLVPVMNDIIQRVQLIFLDIFWQLSAYCSCQETIDILKRDKPCQNCTLREAHQIQNLAFYRSRSRHIPSHPRPHRGLRRGLSTDFLCTIMWHLGVYWFDLCLLPLLCFWSHQVSPTPKEE